MTPWVKSQAALFASCVRLSATFSASRVLTPLLSNRRMISAKKNLYLVGGDFAGLTANFDPSSGRLIPVPEYLVPDSLLEWGQAPKCLEVITSELLTAGKGGLMTLERQTLTVLPEVGCGLDNLETTKTEESTEDGNFDTVADNAIALDYPLRPRVHETSRSRVETTFGLRDSQRIRILLDVTWGEEFESKISVPATVIMERQTSPKSSEGKIADGGGLDARTVSGLLGKALQSERFAEQKPLEALQLSGSWQRSEGSPMDDSCSDDDSWSEVILPGNVIIKYRSIAPQILDVVHVSSDTKTRRIVRRTYEHGKLVGDPEYWTEERVIDSYKN